MCSKLPESRTPLPERTNAKCIKRKTGLEIVAALKQCRDLRAVKSLHQQAFAAGFHRNKYVSTALIKMYSKCSTISLAQEVFDGMIHRDVVAWTSLILAYVDNGDSSRALELFYLMDCEPDSFTYVAVLKALACLGQEFKVRNRIYLDKGIAIHKKVRTKKLESNAVVSNMLIDMYAKCGSMILAQGVFDSMIRRDAISWNSLILGYAENGQNLHALEVFACMDCDRSSVTFVGATMAVKNLACEDQSRRGIFLERGILIHQQARELGFESDIVVASSFIDMYAKCGGMFLAREVFDSMKRRNVVTWNSLIWGYIENGELSVALDLFANHMNCEPSYVTFVAVLKAVGLSAKANESLKKFYYEKGIEIHKKIRERRLDSNIVVANTLIDMYSKCGSVENAKEVFDKIVDRDVVAWNSMISGYTENGENLRAIDLFLRINCKPSSATYLSVLKACASLASDDESRKQFCLENGILIHQQVIYDNLESDVSVSTALIDMYSKCGSMQNARDVFKKMVHPDVVTWTSLISGFVENGENLQALEVFSAMDCEADAYAYVAALKACECLATLDSGKKIHNRLCRVGLEQDQVVAAALVNFYMKCGTLRKAEEIFYSMKCPDVVSWNTMITGYSSHGKHSQLFELAKQMKDGGVQMNIVTYSCIFMACSHMGLVAEGRLCFEAMVHRCGIASLNANHYNCMVDLLCRANMLEEALAIIRGMPQSSGGADAVIWRTLLGACKKWRNLEIANVAFGALVAAGSKDSADYILMSDIYASFSL